jgi:hypothetical protein
MMIYVLIYIYILLMKALAWAKQFEDISDEEIEIIVEPKKSILFMNGEFWTKKGDNNFDVAQGGFYSAEICDLVGLFLLSEIEKLKLNANLGKFRDDGLGVSSATPRQREQIKKKKMRDLQQAWTENNRRNEENSRSVFDIEKDTYKPFIKPNDTPIYVNRQSDHPQTILKNTPGSQQENFCFII